MLHIKERRKKILFLRNWIRSGINRIGDLQFKDGVLDDEFIFNTVKDKLNLYAEIMMVKHAL